MTTARYLVRHSPKRARPFAVLSPKGEIVELHATEAAAEQGARWLNRECCRCGLEGGQHTETCDYVPSDWTTDDEEDNNDE